METINLDKHPVPLEPSFWIVVLAAGIQPVPITEGMALANIEFYQSRVIAYTRPEAVKAVLNQLQAEQPSLWNRGQGQGGWKITHVDQIPAQEMEKLFKERAERERDNEVNKVAAEKNELLKKIAETKDVTLLHKAIRENAISAYERAYLHDILTKDMPKEVAEVIKSPYQL